VIENRERRPDGIDHSGRCGFSERARWCRFHAPHLSVSPDFQQSLVIDSEVVCELMQNRLANDAGNIASITGCPADGALKERDHVRWYETVSCRPLRQWHPLIKPEERTGAPPGQPAVMPPRFALDHQRDVVQSSSKLLRQAAKRIVDHVLEFAARHDDRHATPCH